MGERFCSFLSFYFRGNRRCAPREREVTRTDTEHKRAPRGRGERDRFPGSERASRSIAASVTAKRRNRGGDSSSVSNLYKGKNTRTSETRDSSRDEKNNAFPRFFRDRLSHYHKCARARVRDGHTCTGDRVILAATLVSRGGGTPAACITFFIRYRNYLIPRASESVGGALLQPAVASVRARVRDPARLCISQCAMVLAGVRIVACTCTSVSARSVDARRQHQRRGSLSVRPPVCGASSSVCVSARGGEVERKMCGEEGCVRDSRPSILCVPYRLVTPLVSTVSHFASLARSLIDYSSRPRSLARSLFLSVCKRK